MGQLLDLHIERIRHDPISIHGFINECVQLGDIDALAHILTKVGPAIYSYVFFKSLEQGDIEMARSVISIGQDDPIIYNSAGVVLVDACQNGDDDVVRFIITKASTAISRLNYCEAIHNACHHNHRRIIKTLKELCDDRLDDFKSAAESIIKRDPIEHKTLVLLCKLFQLQPPPKIWPDGLFVSLNKTQLLPSTLE